MIPDGLQEGSDCPTEECGGTLKLTGECSCHINPPCGRCEDPELVCAYCGFSTKEDFEDLFRFDP